MDLMVNEMRTYIVKICLLPLMLLGIQALCASDGITLTLDRNYYNPHAVSWKYTLSVPPVPQGKQYRLLFYRADRKRNNRMTLADIELPCKREHELYFFIEKDYIRIVKPESKSPASLVPNAKISIHLRGQRRVDYSHNDIGSGYVRYANTYRGEIDSPIRVLEFFSRSGPISMNGKNIVDFGFGNPADFNPFDLMLEIKSADISKNVPPPVHAKIDIAEMRKMNLSELRAYLKTMEEKYRAGEVDIEELNLIQDRMNELLRQSR